jgi:hypothetical protein
MLGLSDGSVSDSATHPMQIQAWDPAYTVTDFADPDNTKKK